MKIIAVANQKGGTAETTTAAALAVLGPGGTPTHLIDMDPQGSLTRAFGLTDGSDCLYHALMQRAGLPVQTVSQNLTLTPSTIELGRAETELLGETGREYFLRTSLERTQLPENAVVFLDCPPSLGLLALNSLAAAGGMIAVIQPGGFELHAIAHLHMTVEAVQQRVNSDLHVLGAVITNAHRRRKITGQVAAEVNRLYPVLGVVRTDSRLLSATTAGLIHKLTSSKALNDYAEALNRLDVCLGMSKQAAAGIHNILDGILSPESRWTSTLPQAAAPGSSSIHTAPASKTSEEQQPPIGARRGRPLGKPAAAALPKTKVTLWLNSSLVASYRDWSWEARSQFSHLVEKALTDYYQRQRNPGSAKR